MTPAQEAADAAAIALRKYREALSRYGFAASDGWALAYFRAKRTAPDDQLAAIVRAVVWARDEKGSPGRGRA